jgi:AcrR family transcriptional regulator
MVRTRDQAKYDSIVEASIQLTNELGFDGISIAKIADKAGVAPGTIYIYFVNKIDLFTKIYTDIRTKMGQGALEGLQEGMTVKEVFKSIWQHSFTFNLDHPEYLTYREQFEQTAMMGDVRAEDFELYRVVDDLLKRGIKERTIKDMPLPILASFAYYPVITLLRFHQMGVVEMNEGRIRQACEIAWDAICTE